MPYLSVVIPAYNEERRLPTTLESVYAYLSGQGRDFEIIVVDDGSLDQTVAVVETFAKHHDGVRLLSYSPNQGKGHAVRVGMLAARGDYLLIDDADGSSPISELVRLEEAITCGADLAIGSRAKPADDTVVEALAYRKYIGNTFNFIVQSLLLKGIYDTQCGFKLFRKDVARDIFSVSLIDGFGFDVEVLSIARFRGYKIAEVAISWHNVEGSKVNVFTDSPRMLFEVLGVWVRALMGAYSRSSARKVMYPHIPGSYVAASRPDEESGAGEPPPSQVASEPAKE
jgi:dolichyl-phosphate beta-glucosyltransferase